MKEDVCVLVAQSCPILCDPRTAACLTPLSMEFSRQEYWSELPFPSPRNLPVSPASPTLAGKFFTIGHLASPHLI